MCRPAEAAGADSSVSSLEAAATRHVEFVDNDTTLHIRDADTQGQYGLADTKLTQEETTGRAATVNKTELAIDQPSNARNFVRLQNAGWGYFLQLFFKILRKLHRRERFANWQFAVALCFVSPKTRSMTQTVAATP